MFDYIVIGSGFGGSVSAMRLSQKGYKVLVIEAGKKWEDDDFADRNWNLRKYLWMPKIGFYGIQRMNLLKDVLILGGSGVGGGSLNYANTLYVPEKNFFKKDSIKRLEKKRPLIPYYDLAKKMLGCTENPCETEPDRIFREVAEEYGREESYTPTSVAVYFGEEGKNNPDPYFMGEGPGRTGCELCGACMTGCKKNAKNTLVKNYLYFAQKFGTEIIPERKVIDIVPLSEEGDDGYEVTTVRTTGLFGAFHRETFKTKGVVFSAGTLGTLSLLLKLKQTGRLPKLPDTIGKEVRTNSEVIAAARSKRRKADFSKGVAITSSVYPDEKTHIEPARYGRGNDIMAFLNVLMTDGGGKIPRQLRYLGNIIKHPLLFLRTLNPFGYAHQAIFILAMQTHDNYIDILRKRRILWPFSKSLTNVQATEKKNPAYIPIANDFTRRVARRINGFAANAITEVYMNAPITAHIMGGCSIGRTSESGVIDEQNRIKGYHNFLVNDGSQIPENLGVNPALSITAFSERAMSFIPVKPGEKIKLLKVEKKWKIKDIINPPKNTSKSKQKG